MEMLRKFFAVLVVGACAIAVAGLSGAANAEPAYRTKTVPGDFESVAFDLTNAIVNRGLKIDYTGHVSTMLDRTKDATGKGSPYVDGRYYIFCSAQLSQATMQANPDNIAACPYVVFAYELKSEPGKTVVGYRRPLAAGSDASKAALGAIEKLLQSIIDEAAAS
jgi:uncharacterized protein (DUF302 family)